MKKKHRYLTDNEALSLDLKLNKKQGNRNKARYYIDNETYFLIKDNRSISKKAIKKETTKESKPFVLSAWNKKGYMMDIVEYCQHYNLPHKDIKSYKLVSHTGTPFFNILFKENVSIENEIDYTFISEVVKKHIKPIEKKVIHFRNKDTFDRLIYSDVHIGMTPNKDGYALYDLKWDETEILNAVDLMVLKVIEAKKSSILYIDELGDFLDGWDAQTTRKGHALPQNMDNQKAFDVAVNFKVKLIDALINYYDKIVCNNICEDNHAGSFGYVVNSAVKQILEQKYKNVEVNNMRKFINHYFIGYHCFILTHGKDSKNLKFGFKPQLDSKQSEKIDQYCKENGIYKQADFIEFSKGDSHQSIQDYSTSNDFDYCNYPAFSPASEWVQTNFKKSRQGFVFQTIDLKENKKELINFWF